MWSTTHTLNALMVLQIYSAIYLMMHTCIMASTFFLRRLMSPGINGRQCGNNVRCINKHGRSPAVHAAAHFKTIASTMGRFITYAEQGLGVFNRFSAPACELGAEFSLLSSVEMKVKRLEMPMSYIGAARQQRVSAEVFLSAGAMINFVELTRHLKSLGAELLIAE